MREILWGINKGLGWLFDLIWRPFQGIDPIWPLLLVSLPCGVLMLWIFGKASDQPAVKRLKDGMWGNLMAVWIYQHDIVITLRQQWRILKGIAGYLRRSAFPLLLMIVPVVFILAQLSLRLESRPAEVGKPLLVKVHMEQIEDLELEAPPQVVVETPPVRIESLGEVVWRVRPREAGEYVLKIRSGRTVQEKSLVVGDPGPAVSSARVSSAFSMLLYPGEPPLADGPAVRSVEIGYPPLADLPVLGFSVHWLLLFFVFSMIAALAFRRRLGVEF